MDIVNPSELKNASLILSGARSIYHACIVEGSADGVVFGDNGAKSEFLFVWSPYQEGFQLMGKPIGKEKYASFLSFFETTIMPFLESRDIDYVEYGSDTDELAAMFGEIFRAKNIESAPQKLFKWTGGAKEAALAPEYRIERADEDFLRGDYENKEMLLGELSAAYGSDERIPADAIIFAGLYENRIVAYADMLFVRDGFGNISVETEEAHRKKGLSASLTMRTIDAMREKGLTPVWDCTDSNTASERTARKCGFELVGEDTISWFYFDA